MRCKVVAIPVEIIEASKGTRISTWKHRQKFTRKCHPTKVLGTVITIQGVQYKVVEAWPTHRK